MANDKKFVTKNGLQTQNITFVSPNGNEITLSLSDNDVLSFSGDSGQLFSLTDSLTGTIFSVNDISGVPSIEVDDDGTIRFAETVGNILVGTATDDATNKFQVNGSISATGGTSTQWNTAYGWGDHSVAGYLVGNQTITLSGDVSGSGTTSIVVTVANDSHTHDTQYYTETEIDNFFSGAASATGYNRANWDTAFGWGNHATQSYATQTDVTNAISGLIGAAPGTLDTLNELANALGDDPNFATTVNTSLTNRLRVDTAAQGLTGTQQSNAIANLGITTNLANAATAFGWGDHSLAGYTTGNQTITFTGDATGSGTTAVNLTVVDDSHNHTISTITNFAEEVQDVVGAMFTLNTESGINAVYQDTDGTIDLDVADFTISLTGAVTGSGIVTNLGNVSIIATATSDPTLTLAGDATGSATFTNLGDATLTVAVADNSHAHTVANISGLQLTLDGKAENTTLISAGSGLIGGGNLTTNRTISHADTSTQANLAPTGNTFVQGLTFDDFGHVTGATTATASFTNTNTTYTLDGSSNAVNDINIDLVAGGSGAGTDSIQLVATGATSISWDEALQKITISSTDTNTNTTYTAGGGLELTGTVFSHSTSLQNDVSNINGNVVQSISVDAYGHINNIGSANLDGRYYTEAEIENFFSGATAVTGYNRANWDTSFGWGNHASAGYITGYTVTQADVTAHQAAITITESQISDLGAYLTSETSHADVVVDGDFTANGLMTRTAAGVYSTITDNSANWNNAFGWGDHSLAGYITGYTVTQADVTAHQAALTITESQISDLGAYLTSETSHADVVVDGDFIANGLMTRTAAGVYSTITDNSANWNTAFGWGDHSTQSYATQTYVNTQISAVIDTAPGTLDTLNELAAALGDDPNFATTISTALGNRLRIDTAAQGLTGTQQSNAIANLGITTNLANAATAFGWGDHSLAGYITGYTVTQGDVTAHEAALAIAGTQVTAAAVTDGHVLTASSGSATWAAPSGGGGGITWVTKTAAYTAASGEGILADTTTASFTLTLPATPSAGDTVSIADMASSWATNNLTVARNGSTIEGATEDLVMDIGDVKVELIYNGATWEIYVSASLDGAAPPPVTTGKAIAMAIVFG